MPELDENGAKTRTFVYQGGEVLAWQQQSASTQTIAWEHRDMSNASVTISGLPEGSKGAELEPLGMDAGAFHLIAPLPPTSRPPLKEARSYPGFADMLLGSQCRVDGIDMPCGMAGSEATALCPAGGCGPDWDPTLNDGRGGYKFFEATVKGSRYRNWVEAERAPKYSPDRSLYGEVTYGKGYWAYSSAGSNPRDSLLEHGSNFGISPQETKLNPPPKGFPCPPSVFEVFTGKGTRLVKQVLLSTWESAQQTKVEQGGWIYMNKQRRLIALQKERGREDTQTEINLNHPPEIVGGIWIVVMTFHTHDYNSEPSQPTSKQFSLPNDVWINERQRVPGIILGGTNGTSIQAYTPFGPTRGYWYSNLPRRCQK